jgi:hypothetical protein
MMDRAAVSILLCVVSAVAALTCAAGWYIEHRRRVAVLQRYRELTDAGIEATRVIIRLTAALQAKGGRADRASGSIPHRVRMYVN